MYGGKGPDSPWEWTGVIRRMLILALAAGALAASAGAEPSATPAIRLAQDSCSASCRSQHSACRVATKGAQSCDVQLTACLQRCIAAKGR